MTDSAKAVEFFSSEVGLIVQLGALVAGAVPPLVSRISSWASEASDAQRAALVQLRASLANVQIALSTLDGALAAIASANDKRLANIPSEGNDD